MIATAAAPASAETAAEPLINCQTATLTGLVSTFEGCDNVQLGIHLNATVHVSQPVSITYFCTNLNVLVPLPPLTSINAVGVNCAPIGS
ncbi:hypothetical protein [Streptomyces sp. NPDC005876]|uniref:hypothetical protein n=1 Tax=unclassified Streptomyces TaxID=2593676 RepID=UPI0033EC0841